MLTDENKPTVKLIGENGNAFYILGKVKKALTKAGFKKEAEEYVKKATSGDYDNLLMVTMDYVNVE